MMMATGTPALIRILTADDAAQYQALRLRALRDHPEAFGALLEDEQKLTLEQVARHIEPEAEDYLLGAFVDGALAGTLGLGRFSGGKRKHHAQIFGMYVAPEQRKQGIGRALLEEAIRRARAMGGLEMITLAVSVGNHAARALYVSAGFEPHYVEWHYLKIGEQYVDMEWMRLNLI